MNQRKAKELRKEIYGDLKQETTYSKQMRKVNNKLIDTGAIICNNPRREYLDAKKSYKENKC